MGSRQLTLRGTSATWTHRINTRERSTTNANHHSPTTALYPPTSGKLTALNWPAWGWDGMPKYSTCPVCSQRTELTPKRGRFRVHTVDGTRCRGSGRSVPVKRSRFKLKVIVPILAGVIAAAASIVTILQFAGVSPPQSKPTAPATGTTTLPPVKIASSPRQLVSSNSTSTVGDGDSGRPSFDASGRYVVFT